MNKLGSILYILSVAVFLASCGKKTKVEEQEQSVCIDTVVVADDDANLQFPGRVVSSQEANVSFKVAGSLKCVYVKEGDHVTAGQLIAEIDPVDYNVQLSAAEAQYAQIKADADRVTAMYHDGAATASQYDKARYGLQQIQAKLQNCRNQVAYCKLYAPFSGNVKTLFFDSRETVGVGMPVLAISGNGTPEIEVNLPATSYLHHKQFATYTANFDVLPGKIISLKYVNLKTEANANQLYTLRLAPSVPNSEITPGMSAWVTIGMRDSMSVAVRIPSTSIVKNDDGTFVFLYEGATHLVHQCDVTVQKLHTDGTAVVV